MVCEQGGISGLRILGRTFGGLVLQGQPGGSSERNIFEYSCTEEETGAVKAIFEDGFNFVTSKARKKFNIAASAVQRE